MTGRPSTSLIIVSRHRPECLARCLSAIAHLDHPNFEVILVADPDSLTIARGHPVKTVPFDASNISAARNAGIAVAAGEVVAFTDDDATPEPLWLWHLTAPFADPSVAAAGGFTLGWNGLSFEWQGGTVDRCLRTGALHVPSDQVSLHVGRPGLATEIKGVNCAYRRSVLAGLGGFDPALAYYLDETELNLRIAALGQSTAYVPEARVHHRKAESPRRRADRTPLSLWDIGASAMITLRRHGASLGEIDRARTQLEFWEGRKIAGLRRRGRIGTDEAARLRATLEQGVADGLARALPPLAPLGEAAHPFQPYPANTGRCVILSGRPWQAARLANQAAGLAAAGHKVRLFLFSPTARYHQRRFQGGYWLQSGGLFGKSLRSDRTFRFWRFSARLARESSLFLSGFRKI